MNSNKHIKKWEKYVLVTLLLVLTTFEYFFREGSLTSLFFLFCVILLITSKIKLKLNHSVGLFFSILILFPIFHYLKNFDCNLKLLITSIISSFGIISIAVLCRDDFIKCFIRIIYVISIYSLIIWFLSFIPEIKDVLYTNLASNFKSLNNEIALMDEGGRNIVIYNFQSNYIDEIIGISRNCGPFWEPGMFAVFIITGLFLYNFISTTKLFGFNLIMIVSLISTVSTGGVICGLLFGIMYLTKNNISKRTKIILIPIFCIVVAFVLSLDYIGLKTLEQLENSNVGSDSSRFGAIRTQIHMILNSPILGGEKIENYTRGKTLASGLLLPFVNYGILCGSLFYGFMLKSFTNIFNIGNLNKYKSGIYFFVIILALSISQTILLTPFFETLIIVGLIKTQNNIKSYSYEYTNYLK